MEKTTYVSNPLYTIDEDPREVEPEPEKEDSSPFCCVWCCFCIPGIIAAILDNG